MKHLDISDVFKFHVVFDDISLNGAYYDVFEAIEGEIFTRLDEFKERFKFNCELEKPMKVALTKLSDSDRKRLNINKIMPQSLANKTYAKLFEKKLIFTEKSREIRPIRTKREKLKKSEKRYLVQDKIHFCNHFTRFWFRFIEPNLYELENGDKNAVLERIRLEFDDYASLGFELVCAEFLKLKGIQNVSSFWHKNIEIDLLGICEQGIVVSEVKYRSKKICKNILNLLLLKCLKLCLQPDIVYLFSKSGFSKELMGMKNEHINLVDITDMTELLHE